MDMIDESFKKYRVGQILNGVVVQKTEKGLIVNIGGKSDGLISGDEEVEFLDLPKNTKLDVMVMSTKTEEGTIKVSAKRAVDTVQKNLQIPEIKKGAKFTATIESATKAGLNAFFGAWRVFVPASEIEEFFVRDLDRYKGQELTLTATDFDEEKRQIVASKKAHEVADKNEKRELFWHGIFINKLVTGRVVRLTDFGAFVEVNGVDCLVHNTEVSYERNKRAQDIFEIGKEYQFRVISVDRDANKVQLSFKAAQKHPFDIRIDEIQVGEKYEVAITKILPYGAIAKLENGLEGMIHISAMSSSYIQSVHEVCKVGEKKMVIVQDIDRENRRISLSIKAYEESQIQ